MLIRPCAEFTPDFPDDRIEEDGEIIQFGGRGVAEAISTSLRGHGYEVTPPEHQGEYGWDFEVRVQKRRIWILISDLGDGFILQSRCYAGLFPRRQDETIYAEVLNRLNEALIADGRFGNVRWMQLAELQTDAPGAETPVAATTGGGR